MSIKNTLNQAEQLHRAGSYRHSIELCQTLLSKKPKLFDAVQLLALNYQALSMVTEAIATFEKALQLNSKHAATYNNMGNLYVALEDYKTASGYYSKAIRLAPLLAEAHHNLGLCQYHKKDLSSAVELFKKAILINPKIPEFHTNLGITNSDQGSFTQALEYFLTSLELEHRDSKCYWEIFKIHLYQHRYQEAIEAANIGLSSQFLSESNRCQLLIGQAIIFWLCNCINEARQAIQASENIYRVAQQSKHLSNMAKFHRYIKELLALKEQQPELYQANSADSTQELYFISESHGLAPNGTVVRYQNEVYKIRSLFVLGAKLFHFTTPEDNKYQMSLATALESLPANSKVVLGFGEIDCRYNDGILKHSLSSGKSYQSIIDAMLSEYVATLKEIADACQLELIFYGVPAPHASYANRLEKEKQAPFKEMIAYFNQRLKQCCQTHQCPLLDTYQLTNEYGVSNLKHHIDGIHLAPYVVPTLFNSLST